MAIQLLLSILFAIFVFLPSLSDSRARTWLRNHTDQQALLAFKSYITYDPEGALDSWNVTAPFCTWRAVTCKASEQRVIGISLENLSLFGSVAPHLGNLSFLRRLSLQNNSLTGEIPPELGKLTRLKKLNLSLNRIEGSIPASIGMCSHLALLDLTSNRLQGTIPSELGQLSMLDGLVLSDNFLSGSIPASFGNLSSLSNIILMRNSLRGSIPESLGYLSFLVNIQLGMNRLDGEVPLSIFNRSSLIQIVLAVNRLSGTLPSDMFSTLPSLATFFIGGNGFSGRLPVSLGNASSLVRADLSDNRFSGHIPLFQNLLNIKILSLQNNDQLVSDGRGGWDFLASLSNSTQLEVFSLAGNSLRGELPACVGNLSRRLSLLVMEDNQLEGRLPNELGYLVGLTLLSFEYNNLSGLIPASIGSLPILQSIYLHENRLSGEIPQSLANLSALYVMILYGNSLTGAIPSSFGKLGSLQMLDLSANKLNGTIPKEIFDNPSLSLVLNLSFNSLSGHVPLQIGSLKMIQVIDISSNQFSGVIPSSLGGCSNLVYLNVSRNSFGGPIPDTFGNMKGIEYLDLSYNNISGTIPLSLDSLRYLHLLDVSMNRLQGILPTKGVFSNKTGLLIAGNPELCGGLPEFGLRKCTSTQTKHAHGSKTKLIVGLVVGIFAVLMFLGALLVLVVRRKCPPRTREASSRHSLEERQFYAYSYYDLKGATGDFSPANLIGEGRFGAVYKGVFRDGSIAAIKVLKMEDRGASKSFRNECEALRNIRHRNLVKIISVCSNPDFKALILTYMPNGSLEDWLHSRGETARSGEGISIRQRLEIARDVASALEYMHHDCETLIVHCDLKPSNVLLDENMCAHVADFGIAKLLSNDVSNIPYSSTSGLKGTVGYIAPEYGSGGGVSPKGDVYSYGIMLLEVFTGRRPTDEAFSDELDLPRWVSSALPDRVADVLDPELIRSGWKSSYDDSMAAIFEIGLSCSSKTPETRPAMREVSSLIANVIVQFS